MFNTRSKAVWQCVTLAVFLHLPLVGMAMAVYVEDKNGQPVANAVISLSAQSVQAVSANRTAIMDQKDRQFVPEVLVVQQGTEVTFPNSDDIRHHVYSFSPAKKFELRLYHGTTAKPVTFEQAGKVVLGCNIHDSMLGYIFVVDSPYYALSSVSGVANISAPDGEYTLSVQHYRSGKVYESLVRMPEQSKVVVTLDDLAPDPKNAQPTSELEALFQ
ncbi:methylamine utilization protein [Gilvimarinus sp. SDUM040013]|uniref:Methylamine utilization protein n=1 Tax=Gilvimarinus gilvus TaxID=3058038 RepID=A0ABU4S3B9_9GAMM|nr:methylamine utilization protein [Gilvimarinus sp. SDUM040013]MDO3388089.1 methylamine utilization protein [Gilvimarinus sp. SDUM040013]MDX6850997.1 methylamine utilization protein [Gilvimarinus sp. SDUM040013]